MTEIFVDSLYDAVLDCLKVLPILFLAYLLVSFLSHDHSHKFNKFLSKNKKSSVFYASLLGCVPQCGFSSVLADLYSQKHVSIGTLIAVFVATSDEAIPILLTTPNKIVDLLILIVVKVVLAIFWGYAIDLIVGMFSKRKKTNLKMRIEQDVHKEHEIEESSHKEHIHECGHIHSENCEESCNHTHGNCCVNNVFLDAFLHTFNIILYIFVATFAINLIIGFCGMSVLENLLSTNVYLQVLFASLIGLIPNCASSVLLVELFAYGSLGFPALLAGLTSGAGVGLIILWTKNKRKPLQNLGILILQFSIGVVSGMVACAFMLLI